MMRKVTEMIEKLIKILRKQRKASVDEATVEAALLIAPVEIPAANEIQMTPVISETPAISKTPAVPEISETAAPPATSQRKRQESVAVSLTERVNAFLQANYDFRYNLLTEETEFRPLGGKGKAFRPIGKRELNTLCMEAHVEGISCWDKDVSRYIYSTRIEEYHPFRLYMDELPGWDGIDRLGLLALRVSDSSLWISHFHTWLLGLAAQWEGRTGIHANSVAPILVSAEQGRMKSTFCKSLMPDVLQRYYLDNLKLTSQGQAERLTAEMGLINLDEFDKYATGKMPLLKNLMQMSSLNICKAYQHNFRNLPRIASFIGTSNRYDLLSDPTGSRRFICVEVKRPINCDGIEHAQIFAQLKAELNSGHPYWFSKEEERMVQRDNVPFYRTCPAEEVFHCCFRAARPDEGCLKLSAVEIYKEIKKYNAAALRGFNPNQFAQVLMGTGIVRKHTEYGNVYLVMRR